MNLILINCIAKLPIFFIKALPLFKLFAFCNNPVVIALVHLLLKFLFFLNSKLNISDSKSVLSDKLTVSQIKRIPFDKIEKKMET
ncbi:hypothetical protein BpHYR1_009139 [Brachionus plicatilis]|uniref:Uncharacterized protein n=1 Tax=Brachionus plicatilis TaxID=10195 RepID=A0A3M7Q0U0_BRAPC|nr:hypothetical protein BpHYR1_009139 [Brachionus plicatilis]